MHVCAPQQCRGRRSTGKQTVASQFVETSNSAISLISTTRAYTYSSSTYTIHSARFLYYSNSIHHRWGSCDHHAHAPKGLDSPWTSTYKYRKVQPQQPQYVDVSQQRPLTSLSLTFPSPSSFSSSPRQTTCFARRQFHSSAITMSFPPVIKLNDGNEIPAVCFSPPPSHIGLQVLPRQPDTNQAGSSAMVLGLPTSSALRDLWTLK